MREPEAFEPSTLREYLTIEVGGQREEISVGDDIWDKLEELGVLDVPLPFPKFVGWAIWRVSESGRSRLIVEERAKLEHGQLLAVLDQTVSMPPMASLYKWPDMKLGSGELVIEEDGE